MSYGAALLGCFALCGCEAAPEGPSESTESCGNSEHCGAGGHVKEQGFVSFSKEEFFLQKISQ